jgi:predicted hydrocarbon binding protein
MTDSSRTELVGVAVPTLRQLRASVLSSNAQDAVAVLREAGFAGGGSIHSAFERWLAETSGAADAMETGDLDLGEFGERVTRFFRDAGWGDFTLTHDDVEGVAIVDIENCWEGVASENAAGCQLTTGMLAAFFGQVAGFPVAVLETECCEGHASRCRFLMGNADVMNYKWQELERTLRNAH